MNQREKKYLISLFSLLLFSIFILVWYRSKDNTIDHNESYDKGEKKNKILLVVMDDILNDVNIDKMKYDIIEFNQDFEKDSETSEINKLVNLISDKYNLYDSFIILRDKNKLTYTSSMLSFLLENLNKTIIVSDTISDNIYNIPEVVLQYKNDIIRGCKAKDIGTDIVAQDYDYLGHNGDVDMDRVLPKPKDKFKTLSLKNDKKISLIKAYPDNNLILGNSDVYIIEGFIDPQSDIFQKIKELVEEKGAIAVNVNGGDKENDKIVEKYVISSDLSPEAAYAKAYMIISNVENCDREMMEKLFMISMRGE